MARALSARSARQRIAALLSLALFAGCSEGSHRAPFDPGVVLEELNCVQEGEHSCTVDSECDRPCAVGLCDNGQCKFCLQDSSFVCRAASGSCDVAETCTGFTSQCPADDRVPGRERRLRRGRGV